MRAFQLIHNYLSGQMAVKSYGGSEYYISFIDDFTRMAWVVFLEQKSDAPDTILHFIARVENQFNTKILCFYTDNGTEYVNSKVAAFFLKKSIQHSLMPPYIHEYNGIAKRFNRTIQTMMRMMLNSQKDLDLKLWAEAYYTAVYLKNRLPHSALNGSTAYEILYNRNQISCTYNPLELLVIFIFHLKNEVLVASLKQGQKNVYLLDILTVLNCIKYSYRMDISWSHLQLNVLFRR